jgi:hypothetical protein
LHPFNVAIPLEPFLLYDVYNVRLLFQSETKKMRKTDLFSYAL